MTELEIMRDFITEYIETTSHVIKTPQLRLSVFCLNKTVDVIEITNSETYD